MVLSCFIPPFFSFTILFECIDIHSLDCEAIKHNTWSICTSSCNDAPLIWLSVYAFIRHHLYLPFIHNALAVTDINVHSSIVVHVALRGQRMDSGTPSGEIFFKTLMNGLYTYRLSLLFNYIAWLQIAKCMTA